jgi:hypothetical protein
MFGAGAALGSAVNAQIMAHFGHQALYGSIAVLTVVMFVSLSIINSKQKAEQPEPSDYVVGTSDVTASPLAATMDPRIEETTAHEQLLVVEEEHISSEALDVEECDEQAFSEHRNPGSEQTLEANEEKQNQSLR